MSLGQEIQTFWRNTGIFFNRQKKKLFTKIYLSMYLYRKCQSFTAATTPPETRTAYLCGPFSARRRIPWCPGTAARRTRSRVVRWCGRPGQTGSGRSRPTVNTSVHTRSNRVRPVAPHCQHVRTDQVKQGPAGRPPLSTCPYRPGQTGSGRSPPPPPPLSTCPYRPGQTGSGRSPPTVNTSIQRRAGRYDTNPYTHNSDTHRYLVRDREPCQNKKYNQKI